MNAETSAAVVEAGPDGATIHELPSAKEPAKAPKKKKKVNVKKAAVKGLSSGKPPKKVKKAKTAKTAKSTKAPKAKGTRKARASNPGHKAQGQVSMEVWKALVKYAKENGLKEAGVVTRAVHKLLGIPQAKKAKA